MSEGTGATLKCVVVRGGTEGVQELAERILKGRAGTEEVRRLAAGAWIVYADAQPADIRDWLSEALSGSDSALVVEFERWSSLGPGIDSRWLLRRGH